jgi:hypothetical protein
MAVLDPEAVLYSVTVDVGDPYGFSGNVWNVGEIAWVRTTITNSSGRVLREVVAELNVFGGADISPLNWGPWFPAFDGKWFRDELEPGESFSYLTRVSATSTSYTHFHLDLAAEVVPYAAISNIASNHMTPSPS